MDKRKTNVAGGTDRELTPGECQIAAGQILDRLTRYFSAGREIYAAEKVHCADDASEEEQRAAEDLANANGEKARLGILEKYKIPAGVSFEVASFQESISPLAYYVGKFKKYILPFVSGTMTEIELTDLVFQGEETVECDYNWIFLDRPSFYYKPSPPGWVEPHVEDFRKIGWRKMSVQPDRWVESEAIKKYKTICRSDVLKDELYAAHLIMEKEVKKQGYGRFVKYNPRVNYRTGERYPDLNMNQ